MFETALPIVLGFEGGYSDDPNDPGGATNKGVTQSTYDSFRKARGLSVAPVKQISDSEVSAIYKGYYEDCMANVFDICFPVTSACHFDAAINMGSFTAKRLLQSAINSTLDPAHSLIVDGLFGEQTIRALYKFGSDKSILIPYLITRKQRYLDLIARNPKLKQWQDSYWHRLNTFAKLANIDWRA